MMNLKEFDDYMTEGGYDYTIMVTQMLEQAAREAKDGEVGKSTASQLDALDMAAWEHDHGKIIEPVVKILRIGDEQFVRDNYKKWRGYLAHVGKKI